MVLQIRTKAAVENHASEEKTQIKVKSVLYVSAYLLCL